jgi:hypothetical protein
VSAGNAAGGAGIRVRRANPEPVEEPPINRKKLESYSVAAQLIYNYSILILDF